MRVAGGVVHSAHADVGCACMCLFVCACDELLLHVNMEEKKRVWIQ